MRDKTDDQNALRRIISDAINNAFDRYVARRSKELGITPEEVVKRLADDIDQVVEEIRKRCEVNDPT